MRERMTDWQLKVQSLHCGCVTVDEKLDLPKLWLHGWDLWVSRGKSVSSGSLQCHSDLTSYFCSRSYDWGLTGSPPKTLVSSFLVPTLATPGRLLKTTCGGSEAGAERPGGRSAEWSREGRGGQGRGCRPDSKCCSWCMDTQTQDASFCWWVKRRKPSSTTEGRTGPRPGQKGKQSASWRKTMMCVV